MRLSEAIRLGAMLRPQAFGVIFDGSGTCALGAAYEAIGKLHRMEECDAREDWPWLKNDKLVCPECGGSPGFGPSVISAHLNDNHLWTREQIADWVETIEQQQDAVQGLPAEVMVGL